MKYNEVYPSAQTGEYVEKFLQKTRYLYECSECASRTYWRDYTLDCSVGVCSIECRKKMLDDYIEVTKADQNVRES